MRSDFAAAALASPNAAAACMPSDMSNILILASAQAGTVTIESLQARRQELHDGMQQVLATADENGRDLTEDELEQISVARAEIDRLGLQISARESVQAMGGGGAQPGTRRQTAAVETQGGGNQRGAQPGQQRVTVAAQPRGAMAGRCGFTSFGEYAIQVRAAGTGSALDQRLVAVQTTYGGEGTGADGGFAVPPDFRRDIWQKVMDEENLLSRCAALTTGSNSITIPKDETTPWQTSGGVQAYWEAEAAQVTASKPALTMASIRLAKLMALVPISDELLDDAPGLESWLRAKAPGKMAAKINTAIIDGSGVGQPLGILRAPATISVTKVDSQTADTLLFANINSMWGRMYAPCRRNAIWLINQDVEGQLDSMAFDPSATSKVPVYMPPGGAADSPYARLKGRPVVPIEACSTIGDKGDIILADLTQYWAVTKAGQDIRTDVSMHLYFDQGLQAFRFTFRVNGQPAWGSNVSPQNGSLTRSCFVTLDARG